MVSCGWSLGHARPFFSRPSPKAGRELQSELDRIINGGMRMRTLSEKSAGAGHRAVSLNRHCVLVFKRTPFIHHYLGHLRYQKL